MSGTGLAQRDFKCVWNWSGTEVSGTGLVQRDFKCVWNWSGMEGF